MILHIIGLILKIIGIILLVILGILLLLIGIFLFVPLRYELCADFPGKLEEAEGTLKISWLLHLISGKIIYKDGNLKWQGRLAWKKLGDISEKEQTVRRSAEKSVKKRTSDLKKTEKEVPKNTEQALKKVPEDRRLPQKPEPEEKQERQNTVASEEKKAVDSQKILPETEETILKNAREGNAAEESADRADKKMRKRKKPVKAFGKWIRKISRKIQEFLKKIKCTWKNICDKIKNIIDRKDKILAFLEEENHKAAFERGKKELVWIRRFIKPKKLKARIHYGFEDPYHTGQVLALGGVLYAFIGENVELEPDFEKRVLDGDIYMKGRLRAFHMVMFAAKMLLDKNVRSTYQDIRTFEW